MAVNFGRLPFSLRDTIELLLLGMIVFGQTENHMAKFVAVFLYFRQGNENG